MSSLGTYYYLISVLFAIDAICDFIFSGQYSVCPFGNNAASIFMLLFILNTIIVVLCLLLGYLIKFFDGLDPDELFNLGWFKKLLGILVKILPTVIKIIHIVKLGMVLFNMIYLFNPNLTTDYLTDPNYNLALITDVHCKNATSTLIVNAKDQYKKTIFAFEAVELFSVYISLFVLGVVKNLLDIEGYFFEPQNLEHGKIRKICMNKLGP